MRVLHIIDTMWLGGAQTLVKTLFEKQRDDKNIFLFVLRETKPKFEVGHSNLFTSFSSRYSLFPVIQLKKIITENKIDALHCHLIRSHIFGIILKRFFFPKLRLILHDHGECYDNPLLVKVIYSLFSKEVERFIACSKNTKSELVSVVHDLEGKIEYLPNFTRLSSDQIKKSVSACTIRLVHGIPDSAVVFGFAGRIVRRKGWKEFILSVEKLRDMEDVYFLIAGIGPDEKAMLQLISNLNLKSKIIFLGYISDMTSFFGAIDCLVIPSYWEGQSIIHLEANALRIPSLISKQSGSSYSSPESLFEAYDVESLSGKLTEFIAKKRAGRLKDGEYISDTALHESLFMEGLKRVYSSDISRV